MRKIAGGVLLGIGLNWFLPFILVVGVVIFCLTVLFADKIKESTA